MTRGLTNREERSDGSRHPLGRSDNRYTPSDSAAITAVAVIVCVLEGTDLHPPTELIESTEPVLPIDKIDPADPIERIDPALPIDAIEPAEPIDAIDPALPIDAIDPTDPIEAIEVEAEFRFVTGPCMQKA